MAVNYSTQVNGPVKPFFQNRNTVAKQHRSDKNTTTTIVA